MDQNNKKVDYLPAKNYPKQIIKEKCTATVSKDSEHDKCWSEDSAGHKTRYLGNESSCQNNHLFAEGKDELVTLLYFRYYVDIKFYKTEPDSF